MFKKIKRFFMGLANRNEKVEQNNNIPPIPPFSKEELEFLLKLVSDCTFKGNEVQVVYDLVYKLQQLYIK
jgi:hypothetical protein